MSKLSVFLHQAGDFLSGALQKAPADQQAPINDAAQKLTTAAQAATDALPVLAKVLVDALLAMIPGFGKYIPAFDELLDIIAAEVLSRKTGKA